MKKLGIVGGVAWPSTIDYYRAICRLSAEYHRGFAVSGPLPVPEMSIESLDINKSFGLRGGDIFDDDSWTQYDAYFRDALLRLQGSGAEVAIIASITPHNRFEAITTGVEIPVLSIFEVVAKQCQNLAIEETLILGTAPTMNSPKFPQVLRRFGILGQAPADQADRAEIVKLIDELYADTNDDAARRIDRIVRRNSTSASRMPTACLACTELPLAFKEIEHATHLEIDGVLYVNTAMVHATAVFRKLLL